MKEAAQMSPTTMLKITVICIVISVAAVAGQSSGAGTTAAPDTHSAASSAG